MNRKPWLAVTLLLASVSAQAQWPGPRDQGLQLWPAPAEGESYLGVYLSEVTTELAELLRLPQERGAHVNQVVDGSPAAEAGLETDDVLLSWNGMPVESARQFTRMVRETPPGREVALEVFRKGETLALKARIGSLSALPPMPPALESPPPRLGPVPYRNPFEGWHDRDLTPNKPRLGILMQPLTEQLAAYFGLEGRLGALVTTVMDDTPAAAAGLKAGDIVLEVNGASVDSPMAAQRAIAEAGEAALHITVLRDKSNLDVTVPALSEDEDASDGDSSDAGEESGPEKEPEASSYPPDSM